MHVAAIPPVASRPTRASIGMFAGALIVGMRAPDPQEHVAMHSPMQVQHVLAIGWWAAIAFSVCAYVVLDGADLGAGIFTLLLSDQEERGAIMHAIAGTWDANETWLVIAVGLLLGSFPSAYGSLLAYLMVPLMLMLWGIMVRAVALELHHHASPPARRGIERIFGAASLLTTFAGGVSGGAILQGFPLDHPIGRVPEYAGGALRFLSPFSLWSGCEAVAVVMATGNLFILARFRPGEAVRRSAGRWTDVFFLLATAAAVSTLAWMAAGYPWVRGEWAGDRYAHWTLLILCAACSAGAARLAVRQRLNLLALVLANLAVSIAIAGMTATLYPNIAPGAWTIFQALNPQASLSTLALTLVFFLPTVVFYNVYQINVFWTRIGRMRR